MPNGLDKVTSFVPKVYDYGDKRWWPLYIPPDGTDTVKGMVFLTDDVVADRSLDAADGMTAVSPKCVGAIKEYAETNIEQHTEDIKGLQTRVNDLENDAVTGVKGAKESEYRRGNVNITPENIGAVPTSSSKNVIYGTNASSANMTYTKIDSKDTAVSSSARATSVPTLAYIDSLTSNAVIDDSTSVPLSSAVYGALRDLDAEWLTKGTIPLDRIPHAAMERLVRVADESAMLSLTTDNVQKGDTVQCIDTGIMYIVVDDEKLDSMDGYQEYSAGIATHAATADVANSVDWDNVQNKRAVSSTEDGLMTPEILARVNSYNAYELPTASSTELGGIKTGFATNETARNYAVQMSGENAYVNVPWGYAKATTGSDGLMSAADKAKLESVSQNANHYILPRASSSDLGGIKTGYSQNNRNYPVTLDGNDNAYVNVPWVNDNTWTPNTNNSDGYVTSGKGQANKVWKTDASGNPGWRDDANTVYILPDATTGSKGGVIVGAGLNVSNGTVSAKIYGGTAVPTTNTARAGGIYVQY